MSVRRTALLGLPLAILALLIGALLARPAAPAARADGGTTISFQTVCELGSTFDPNTAAATTTSAAVAPPIAVACGAQAPVGAGYSATSAMIDWDDGTPPTLVGATQGASHSFTQTGTFLVVDTITVCSTARPSSCAPIAGTPATINIAGTFVRHGGCGGDLAPDGQFYPLPCTSTPILPSPIPTPSPGTAGAPQPLRQAVAYTLCDHGTWVTAPQSCTASATATPAPQTPSPAPPPPTSPTNLAAATDPGGRNGVTLSWTASPGATAYALVIDIDGAISSAQTAGDQTSYALPDVQPGQQACFTIVAGNGTGWSAWTAWTCAAS